MTLRTFGFAGTLEPLGGLYGLGEVTGGPLGKAVVTTLFNVTDALHPTPHNGCDLASLEASDAPILCPLGGIVAANYAVTWPGPGEKVLFDYTDSSGRHRKALQPGDLDRGGNTLILIHPGPWRLLDGSTVANAATLYCHLQELPPLPVGTWVETGDVIGRQGTTGYSTGEHLHWSLAFQREPTGFFPPNMSDPANNSDPLAYIGVPVADVSPPPPPQAEFLPEPDGFDLPVVARLWQYVVAGGAVPDADVTPVSPEREGWDYWKVGVKR